MRTVLVLITAFALLGCSFQAEPDGTPKKQLDISRLSSLGWRAQIDLKDGLISTMLDFREKLSKGIVRL